MMPSEQFLLEDQFAEIAIGDDKDPPLKRAILRTLSSGRP